MRSLADFDIDVDDLPRSLRGLLRFSRPRDDQEDEFDAFREKHGLEAAIRSRAEYVRREATRNSHINQIHRSICYFAAEWQDEAVSVNTRHRLRKIKDRIETAISSTDTDLMTSNHEAGVRQGKLNFLRDAEELLTIIEDADLAA